MVFDTKFFVERSMNNWPDVKHLFATDDGSLPDIYIRNISHDQTIEIYDWLMKRCKITGDARVWSIEKKQEVLICDLIDPAEAVIDEKVEAFMHGLVELRVDSIELPRLAVTVSKEGISFDYRMGAEWTERAVLALFKLLHQIHLLAPNARIFQTDEGYYSQPNHEFSNAFKSYIA